MKKTINLCCGTVGGHKKNCQHHPQYNQWVQSLIKLSDTDDDVYDQIQKDDAAKNTEETQQSFSDTQQEMVERVSRLELANHLPDGDGEE